MEWRYSSNSFLDLGFPGSENVQAAQKYITGLDARRLSKFPEYRYVNNQIHFSLKDHFNLMQVAESSILRGEKKMIMNLTCNE